MEAKIKVAHRKKARIEIIPLIDVIFFLLATFVLFILSLDRIQSVPVNLPYTVPNPDRNKDPDEIINLQVSDGDTLYWNREAMSVADLPARLVTYKSEPKHEDPKILLTCDDKARFRTMIAVLDQIRLLGIKKVSVETRETHATGK